MAVDEKVSAAGKGVGRRHRRPNGGDGGRVYDLSLATRSLRVLCSRALAQVLIRLLPSPLRIFLHVLNPSRRNTWRLFVSSPRPLLFRAALPLALSAAVAPPRPLAASTLRRERVEPPNFSSRSRTTPLAGAASSRRAPTDPPRSHPRMRTAAVLLASTYAASARSACRRASLCARTSANVDAHRSLTTPPSSADSDSNPLGVRRRRARRRPPPPPPDALGAQSRAARARCRELAARPTRSRGARLEIRGQRTWFARRRGWWSRGRVDRSSPSSRSILDVLDRRRPRRRRRNRGASRRGECVDVARRARAARRRPCRRLEKPPSSVRPPSPLDRKVLLNVGEFVQAVEREPERAASRRALVERVPRGERGGEDAREATSTANSVHARFTAPNASNIASTASSNSSANAMQSIFSRPDARRAIARGTVPEES